jgi:hypothetical protein
VGAVYRPRSEIVPPVAEYTTLEWLAPPSKLADPAFRGLKLPIEPECIDVIEPCRTAAIVTGMVSSSRVAVCFAVTV